MDFGQYSQTEALAIFKNMATGGGVCVHCGANKKRLNFGWCNHCWDNYHPAGRDFKKRR